MTKLQSSLWKFLIGVLAILLGMFGAFIFVLAFYQMAAK